MKSEREVREKLTGYQGTLLGIKAAALLDRPGVSMLLSERWPQLGPVACQNLKGAYLSMCATNMRYEVPRYALAWHDPMFGAKANMPTFIRSGAGLGCTLLSCVQPVQRQGEIQQTE